MDVLLDHIVLNVRDIASSLNFYKNILQFEPERVSEYEAGEVKPVTMHDGSTVVLKKLEEDYDPTNRSQALMRLEDARANQEFITGLIYVKPEGSPTLHDMVHMTDEPLAHLPAEKLRPSREALAKVMQDLL